MTQEETIEFERLKTARDSLLLTVANLRGQIETIAAKEREACAKVLEAISNAPDMQKYAKAIRTRGKQA
jgi:hypothetical protein